MEGIDNVTWSSDSKEMFYPEGHLCLEGCIYPKGYIWPDEYIDPEGYIYPDRCIDPKRYPCPLSLVPKGIFVWKDIFGLAGLLIL